MLGRPMKQIVQTAIATELLAAKEAEAEQEFVRAWRHLERAHILSQADAGRHVLVHLKMFAYGWRRRDRHEVLGQLARLVVAAPGSWLGRAPLGNTGGAGVGILTPMSIPDDLKAILAADRER